jgi:hypothetical protein
MAFHAFPVLAVSSINDALQALQRLCIGSSNAALRRRHAAMLDWVVSGLTAGCTYISLAY